MMDQAIKTKWLEALRSGQYAQTRSVLKDLRGFCCLGVLNDVLGFDWDTPHVNATCEIPGFVEGLNYETRRALANMNDVEGKSFTEIADYIEANL